MSHDLEPTHIPPQQTMNWKQVLLHWVIFIALMTALIGGAALIF